MRRAPRSELRPPAVGLKASPRDTGCERDSEFKCKGYCGQNVGEQTAGTKSEAIYEVRPASAETLSVEARSVALAGLKATIRRLPVTLRSHSAY